MNHRKTESHPTLVLLGFLLTFACAGVIRAQTTAFTYQGRLTDGGTPATGTYDLRFALWDSNSGATQIGATQTVNAVAVSGGSFTVMLDFGVNAFPGADRFLEIGVRPAGVGSFTVLAPRQQISSTPYAIHTLRADALSNSCVACVQDAQINAVSAGKLSGTLPVNSIPAGSANYIQNSTTQQASSNFNVSGNGLIGSSVGIGTASPISKLHLFGSAGFASPFRGLTIDQTVNVGAMTSGYAMSVRTTTNNATSTNFLIDSLGNTGVGTPSPAARLHVAQGGDFQLRLDNPATGGGFWSIGQADNSFHSGGGKLVFVPNTIESTNAAVVFTNAGNVGIGTTGPLQLLHVNSASSNAAALVQTPTNAFAQYQLKSGATNPWIMGTQDNFAGNALIFRNGSTDLMKLLPNGSVTQPFDKGGLVKAMIYVTEDGKIDRCYNGLTGVSLTGGTTNSGCGFSIDHTVNGQYDVNFNFQVSERFISATAGQSSSIQPTGVTVYPSDLFTSNGIFVFTYYSAANSDGTEGLTNSSFFILVF